MPTCYTSLGEREKYARIIGLHERYIYHGLYSTSTRVTKVIVIKKEQEHARPIIGTLVIYS